MKEIFKAILKYIFSNTQIDEKINDVLVTAKNEASNLSEKINEIKEDKKQIEEEPQPLNDESLETEEKDEN